MKYQKEHLRQILSEGAVAQKVLTGPLISMRSLCYALRRERKKQSAACEISFKENGEIGHIVLTPRVEVL